MLTRSLQKILNDTRHDIELYRDRQHAKRLALAELLAAAELAEATAQEERDRERERLKGAEHELEVCCRCRCRCCYCLFLL